MAKQLKYVLNQYRVNNNKTLRSVEVNGDLVDNDGVYGVYFLSTLPHQYICKLLKEDFTEILDTGVKLKSVSKFNTFIKLLVKYCHKAVAKEQLSCDRNLYMISCETFDYSCKVYKDLTNMLVCQFIEVPVCWNFDVFCIFYNFINDIRFVQLEEFCEDYTFIDNDNYHYEDLRLFNNAGTMSADITPDACYAISLCYMLRQYNSVWVRNLTKHFTCVDNNLQDSICADSNEEGNVIFSSLEITNTDTDRVAGTDNKSGTDNLGTENDKTYGTRFTDVYEYDFNFFTASTIILNNLSFENTFGKFKLYNCLHRDTDSWSCYESNNLVNDELLTQHTNVVLPSFMTMVIISDNIDRNVKKKIVQIIYGMLASPNYGNDTILYGLIKSKSRERVLTLVSDIKINGGRILNIINDAVFTIYTAFESSSSSSLATLCSSSSSSSATLCSSLDVKNQFLRSTLLKNDENIIGGFKVHHWSILYIISKCVYFGYSQMKSGWCFVGGLLSRCDVNSSFVLKFITTLDALISEQKNNHDSNLEYLLRDCLMKILDEITNHAKSKSNLLLQLTFTYGCLKSKYGKMWVESVYSDDEEICFIPKTTNRWHFAIQSGIPQQYNDVDLVKSLLMLEDHLKCVINYFYNSKHIQNEQMATEICNTNTQITLLNSNSNEFTQRNIVCDNNIIVVNNNHINYYCCTSSELRNLLYKVVN